MFGITHRVSNLSMSFEVSTLPKAKKKTNVLYISLVKNSIKIKGQSWFKGASVGRGVIV